MSLLIAWFYGWANLMLRLTTRLYAHMDVVGRENVPRQGPLIVVANHLSAVDPELLAAFFPRPVHWMAKQEIFDHPLTGPIARLYGAFPVRRFEADLAALRKAMQILTQGQVIGIFPEGHRSASGRLQPLQPGAALIALRSGAPIVPVGIVGTEAIKVPQLFWQPLSRPHLGIIIGDPFTLPKVHRVTSEAVREGTAIIRERILALLPERYRPQVVPTEM